jgi:alpha-tubulin suppressor-like RCC1 family protein
VMEQPQIVKTNRLLPVKIFNETIFKSYLTKISCGAYHTCAISNNSNSYCWGWNMYILIKNILKIFKNNF